MAEKGGTMVTYLDAQGRYVEGNLDPPDAGDDVTTLLGFLERQRATLAWKCSDLDAAGLGATLGSSRMTLGGMLKHLARFEDDMSAEWLNGQPQREPWNAVDWDTDHDWDWRSAAEETPEHLYRRWQEAVDRSRSLFAAAVATRDTGRPLGAPSLSYILINMIEEYARHNGHADLIRESVDGVIGHDPPG
ncbi:MAG TPA: DUF664 domain-containing protein [Thermomicrobiales bacterium]|nr:DUF664 domain-containing protein [Thermomicrobiales bacterium]